MINNDIDTPEDFEKDQVEKPSLREAWDSNPLLKLAAVALGGAVLLGGYMIFFSKDGDEALKARVHISGVSDTKVVPGQTEVDEAYRKALDESNKMTAAKAEQMGGSALPTPIGQAKGGGLDVPEMPEKPKMDALKAWRDATESGRMKSAMETIEDEGGGPPAEAVPVVQPIRPQQTMKQDPNAMKRLAEQMRVVLAAQAPPAPTSLEITKEDSPYVVQRKAEEDAKEKSVQISTGGNNDLESDDPVQTIVPAGSIAYGQLLNELNSDIQGPVLVQVLSGPFAGGRAIGKISVKDEYMVISFSTVVKDTVSYAVNGIALDENTTLAGQATDVDHHYFTRIILPAAAKFIEGYGSSLAQTGTTVEQTAGGSQAAEQPKPGAKEAMFKGLEEASGKMSEILDKGAERPITVKIAKGTTMGVFFLETVTTGDAEK